MSYNQYLLESIDASDAFACPWRFDKADLPTDMRIVEVSELTYPISMKDMQMGQMDSTSVFILTPALPTGISLDCSTGEISATVCSFTAKQFTGGQVTISVELCTGSKSLITLVVMTDPWPEEAAYKLYSGKDKSESPRSRPSVRRAL